MRKLFRWLDDNILLLLTSFLLLAIPLYPKIPLLDVLPGYIVRVRMEDIFVSITGFLWIVWVFRGKVRLFDRVVTRLLFLYLGIGVLSMISAVFLTRTVPLESLHVGKMLLHFLRRLEYFSLFFIFYSSVKNMRQVKIYASIFVVTVLIVVLYGFGQKYLYWPAFSTMNREFSKGWMLYLTEHARVLSTFGGHYDLAAFIMMALVFLWSIFFAVRSWFFKIPLAVLIAGSFWILILTSSRTSFIAYIAAVSVLFLLWSYRRGIRWAFPRWTIVIFLSVAVMLSFGDLSERFTKLLRIDERVRGLKLLLLTPLTRPPSELAVFLENNPDALSQITSRSDQPPKRERPSDVYQDIPLIVEGTGSASLSSVARTYSKTAFAYDLSTAIRFDALWPMAIKGFKRNPILGSGYSTLNKKNLQEFTEAESTDNDYLRSLGETGILGFAAFYGTLIAILYIIWRNGSVIRDRFMFAVSASLGALLFGLLVNAVYIDVFESSKVAFSFWAMTGFILAGVRIAKRDRIVSIPSIPDLPQVRRGILTGFVRFVKSDTFILIVILTLAFFLRLNKIRNPIADWHSWRQADTSSVTRQFVKHGVNFLYPTYHDLSNIPSNMDNPKGYRFVEFPLYNAFSVIVDKIFVGYSVEISGRLVSIFSSLLTIIFIFLLVRKYSGRFTATVSAFVFAILPYSIYYTRVILPEPFLLFTTTGMLYFFDRAISYQLSVISVKQKNQHTTIKAIGVLVVFWFLAMLFTVASLLVKPFAVFLFLPMAYLWFRSFRFSVWSFLLVGIFFALSIVPFLLWRMWMSQFPEGIPAATWLLNGDGIRFKGAFFFWIFADRLGRLILGYWGLPFLFLGLLHKSRKEGWFFVLWAVSMLMYVTVFATGNVRHDYYQVLVLPIVAIFVAKGITLLMHLAMEKRISRINTFIVMGAGILFMEMFGWYHIRDFYNINHPEIVEAGRAVERQTPQRALVVAPYGGDTAFLYQTHRSGWPIVQGSIEELIQKGAHYYVSVNYDDLTNKLVANATDPDLRNRVYKLIEKTDKYVIIQLAPDRQLPR